ncbi:hypothetical protein STCU_01398 [Strigomonas culicis]|nr:hypothetical protein STCU_01398 [Strigomonas culicis]|eukprot:EPY34704.1 hypothetical protein STCU_01398 [Strigomonas culicis]
MGVGIALGCLLLISSILVILGICVSKSREGDVERELARRREELLARNRREQAQWRERRLRDVVIVLVERGEATEGVPLAFQVQDRDEVSARRQLHRSRDSDNPHDRNFDVALAAVLEEENRRYDADALKTIRAPLRELLAEGRPTECLPAPDIMQLLLQGHEVSLSDMEGDNDDDSEMTTATDTDDPRFAAHDIVVSSAPLMAGTPPPLDGPGAQPAADSDAVGSSTAVPIQDLGPESPTTRLRRERRDKKQEAIIRELHHEQLRQKYRRRTAEEVYGVGCAYTSNPDNWFCQDELIGSPLKPRSAHRRSTIGLFVDLLSPLSPFKGKRRQNSVSAFEGRSPTVSRSFTYDHIHDYTPSPQRPAHPQALPSHNPYGHDEHPSLNDVHEVSGSTDRVERMDEKGC